MGAQNKLHERIDELFEGIDPFLVKRFKANGYKIPTGVTMHGWEHNRLLRIEQLKRKQEINGETNSTRYHYF